MNGAGGPETPTSVLRDQHVKVLKVADVLERILDAAGGDGALDHDALAHCVTFIRLYADALHHGKEEDLLFPELEARGLPRDAGPLAVMRHEHQRARAFASTMAGALEGARAGDAAARARLANAARGWIDLLRGHILKEDRVLFDMADGLIRGPACRSLCAAYDGVCARRFEGCTVAELEAVLDRLEARWPE